MSIAMASTFHALHVARGTSRSSAEALTLDTLRAVRGLAFDDADIGNALAADPEWVRRVRASEEQIRPGTLQAERALRLVRLHRALGDVYGSLEAAHRWLDGVEPSLDAKPRDLIRTEPGLARVVEHIESRCKDCLW